MKHSSSLVPARNLALFAVLFGACGATTSGNPGSGGGPPPAGTGGQAVSSGGATAPGTGGDGTGGQTASGGSGTGGSGTGGSGTAGSGGGGVAPDAGADLAQSDGSARGGAGGVAVVVPTDGSKPPGDIAGAAGTPVVAAHSMTRALFSNYAGKLFQVRRASDGKTQDISVATKGGLVDINALNTFLSGTTGSVAILYDQSGNANDLPQTAAGSQPTITFYTTARGTKMPMAYSKPKQYLRNRDKTKLIPQGAEAQTEYFVVNDKIYNDSCCYDYGNMESKKISDGNGTMNALNIGLSNSGFSTPGAGAGPWGLVDLESGVYSAPTRIKVMNAKSPSMTWDLGFVLSKDNGTTHWTLKVGDAAQGALTTVTDAGLPPGYNPLRQEGGLSLGEGGDGSAAGTGAFFEGVVIAGFTTDATDDSIQANLNTVYGK